ncbi:hypothetical protein PMZ80_008509 [Knufia obscura]|uniref:Heterokaryon incompatibility domain-containing protein n=2 Tax=Knufia TaxID=430999 RepID=A0AAN8I6W7_9EURO|nr:hypothetical protein PMZ80_008509 [Knufia obscura]KAK5951965.1 hypothetical protein OHC33_006851 [Knufia fluminis]
MERQQPGLYDHLQHHDSIRLFKLLPAGHDAACLEGELITVRLSDRPEYRALSYMWGPHDIRTERPLRVNGTILTLRENLASALVAIGKHRRRGKIHKDYYLWIDLICIQQGCIKEKNHQVQQMGNIYMQAKAVWVWLGAMTRVDVKYFTSIGDDAAFRCLRVEGHVDKPLLHLELRMLFWALLNKHWTRTWILQEICLAQRIAIMTDLTIFKESLLQRFIENKGLLDEASGSRKGWVATKEYPDPHAKAVAIISRFEKVLMVRQSILDSRWGRISLCSTICQLAAGSECFEDRDKVFAFLAMSAQGKHIKVDYTAEPHALFWDVLKLLEIRDIHFTEISSLRDILRLDWSILLKSTKERVATEPDLGALRLPCHLDCGQLSKKRERSMNGRLTCRANSYLVNCWFKKDLNEDSRQIMVQLRLSQVSYGRFAVIDAAYCPNEADAGMFRGLGLQNSEIRVLNTDWNERREFVAVNPILWVTLCLLTDLDPKADTEELAKCFAGIEAVKDGFYRRRRATKEFGMPLMVKNR